MKPTVMNSLFPLLILALSSAPLYSVSVSFFPKLRVYIGNALPNNTHLLTVHCQSKDHDLGYHTLAVNEEIHWEFRQNIWETTLYFCHFWWAGKDKSFAVFDRKLLKHLCGKICPWVVKEDGFYINKVGGLVKKNTW